MSRIFSSYAHHKETPIHFIEIVFLFILFLLLLSIILQSFFVVQHVSGPPDNYPVDDLDKGDDAEAEKEAEESSKGGDEVHRAHLYAPFKF